MDGLKDGFIIAAAAPEKNAAEIFEKTNPKLKIIKIEYLGELKVNKKINRSKNEYL